MKLKSLTESTGKQIYLLSFHAEASSAEETFMSSEAYSSDEKRAARIKELFGDVLQLIYDDNPKRKPKSESSHELLAVLTSSKADEYHDHMGDVFPHNITLGEIEIDVPGDFLSGPP